VKYAMDKEYLKDSIENFPILRETVARAEVRYARSGRNDVSCSLESVECVYCVMAIMALLVQNKIDLFYNNWRFLSDQKEQELSSC